MNKQQATAYDVAVWSLRTMVQKQMLMVEIVHRASGGEPDASALAAAIADELGLWEHEDLPYWVMESAEWVVEEVTKKLEKMEGQKDV